LPPSCQKRGLPQRALRGRLARAAQAQEPRQLAEECCPLQCRQLLPPGRFHPTRAQRSGPSDIADRVGLKSFCVASCAQYSEYSRSLKFPARLWRHQRSPSNRGGAPRAHLTSSPHERGANAQGWSNLRFSLIADGLCHCMRGQIRGPSTPNPMQRTATAAKARRSVAPLSRTVESGGHSGPSPTGAVHRAHI